MYSLDIVIPLYFDEDVVEELYNSIIDTLGDKVSLERIIFVNDGSTDNTKSIVNRICEQDSRVILIDLTKNFGQHRAISAGLTFTNSEYVAVMDSDLQDRPDDIIRMLESMNENGKRMSISRRMKRKDSLIKKVTSRLFNIISTALVPFNHDPNLGGFRVMHRSIVDELNSMQEHTGNPYAYLYFMGVSYSVVDVERDARLAGKSGYTFRKSFKLAMDRILTYSISPMRIAVILGVITGLLGLIFGLYSVYMAYFNPDILTGWSSQVILISFFGSLNLIFLGVMGEYISRVYMESRNIPKYMIESTVNVDSLSEEASE
jgi:dolichol-phosphate mannosyltransferase